MGFFDKLFGGKAEQEETAKFFGQSKTVLTPIRGKVLAQADIPDETFAQGILGPGCGIEPTGKTVYAPFDGTVNQVASTLHAVGLTSDDGIEVLIHVGMDTVEMNGKGFKALVKEGDKVKAGTPLLKVDLDAIKAAGHPTATAIIVTNGDDLGELKMLAEGDVAAYAVAVAHGGERLGDSRIEIGVMTADEFGHTGCVDNALAHDGDLGADTEPYR